MSTSFLGMSITPLAVARGAATFIGVFALAMGTHAVTSPAAYAAGFGFPPKSTTGSTADRNPFIAVSGGRIISSGLTVLTLSYLGYDRAIGVGLVAGWVSGFIDGVSIIQHTDPIDKSKTGDELKEETARVEQAKITGWSHWATVSIIAVLGGYLVVKGEK